MNGDFSPGSYFRYTLGPIGNRKTISCGAISYLIRLPSDTLDFPDKGVFLSWSPSGLPLDSATESEQHHALTYTPLTWAKVSPLSGTGLVDNEGKKLEWEPSETRVWPAFGQPGGAFEAIWKCSPDQALGISDQDTYADGGTKGPYHSDHVALWRGLGGAAMRRLLSDVVNRGSPLRNQGDQPPPWSEGESSESGRVKVTEFGGLVSSWKGAPDGLFPGIRRQFSVSVAYQYRVAPLRLRFWGYTWVDVPKDRIGRSCPVFERSLLHQLGHGMLDGVRFHPGS